jgi:hypothetical protein
MVEGRGEDLCPSRSDDQCHVIKKAQQWPMLAETLPHHRCPLVGTGHHPYLLRWIGPASAARALAPRVLVMVVVP